MFSTHLECQLVLCELGTYLVKHSLKEGYVTEEQLIVRKALVNKQCENIKNFAWLLWTFSLYLISIN